MDFLLKPWRGEEKLWMVFWVYGIAGNIALTIISTIIGSVLAGNAYIGGILIAAFWIAFMLYYSISVWRCAFNVGAPILGYIARFLMLLNILSVVGLIVAFVTTDALSVLKNDNVHENVAAPVQNSENRPAPTQHTAPHQKVPKPESQQPWSDQ